MNLENLGLLELNAQEVQEVDGGHPIVRILQGLAILVGYLADTHDCYKDHPIHMTSYNGGNGRAC